MWNLIALDFQALIYFRDVKVLYVKILVHCSIETWGLGGGVGCCVEIFPHISYNVNLTSKSYLALWFFVSCMRNFPSYQLFILVILLFSLLVE